MRLQLRIPEVDPEAYQEPDECVYADCHGRYFAVHQQVCEKAIVDPDHAMVCVKRYKCLLCERTFRVYPQGVSGAQRSQRLKAIGVMLYVLGISYGGVADALAALGWAGSKSSVYRDVQAAGEAVEWIRRRQGARQVQVLSADATYVTCNREAVTIAVGVDALLGDVLAIELVDAESADALRPFLSELQELFEVRVLLSDDQDSYKRLADEMGLEHGVCRRHVNQNVANLVAELGERALSSPDPPPPGVERSVDEFLADLEYVQLLIALRPADGATQLARLLGFYQAAPPPTKGERASLWYRFRLALLRWWDNWSRLTLDQRWNQTHDERLDGTNNAAERAIGWWIKERYRTMRTYKRRRSVRNLANLITFLGAHSVPADLGQLIAA